MAEEKKGNQVPLREGAPIPGMQIIQDMEKKGAPIPNMQPVTPSQTQPAPQAGTGNQGSGSGSSVSGDKK